jgi:UDP-glucose 4-epimerase
MPSKILDEKMDNSSGAKSRLRILVMGGLGFIGSNLSRLLLDEGYQVRIFDKLYGSRNLIADIAEKMEIEEGDAERPDDILRSLRDIDIAIDLIHTTVPGASMKDPAYDVKSNVASHAAWLSRIKKNNLTRIIYVSSGGTVYGDRKSVV